MRNAQSGFSLLELMAAVATVGVLSAVVIPSFLTSKPKAQTADAQAELQKIEASARNYYLTEGKFPGSTVTALPGPNGAACSNAGKKFPVSSLWASDPVWQNLAFHVDQASGWTYHFETTSPTTARIRAVGDPDCDGVLTTIQVDMTADIAMDEENDGNDDSGQVAHNWAPQTAQEAGVYPGGYSTIGTPGSTPSGTTTNLGGSSGSTPGAPSAGTVASNTGSTGGSTSSNTINSTTTTSGTPCNWGNGNGAGQGCVNGNANGDSNNTNNDDGHPGQTGGTSTSGNGNGNNGNNGNGNGNGNGHGHGH
jgi:prepilin-type N-terminal cleavage/methylation domain-containing protein